MDRLALETPNPVGWLFTRPNRRTLIWMAGILAGIPLLVGLLRVVLLAVGLREGVVWVLSTLAGAVVVVAGAFYFGQREQRLLSERERDSILRAHEELHYRLLADNSVDVVAHLRGREVVWISRSVKELFGWLPEQLTGSDFSAHVHPDDLDTVATTLQQVASGESTHVRVRTDTSGGDYRWVEVHGKPYIDANGDTDGMIFSTRIVDEQVEAEQQLEAARDRFEAVAKNAPSAISVLDLEHRYTMVNEAFCQLFGLEVVEDVVGRTEDEILSADALERSRVATARLLAGDGLVEEESINLGHENISVMTQRFSLRNSVGAIAEFVTIRTDITHRKKIERESAERALWEERIGAAIGDGRLLVYAQPIVDIATRKIVEEELLVRLSVAGTEEILPPCDFLPQCEQHGLMPVIDRYMVARAIELARYGRRICVNITGQTIGDATAMSDILESLTDAGQGVTDKIVFEITETTALASPAIAKTFSLGMRELGCQVALDDFGTGYGAFTELRHLDLDALKIDLSFVQNMLQDREDERVVKTIVFVARAYGLATVAEGVETEETLERLAELGVDRAQGYLFSKPQPISGPPAERPYLEVSN